MANLSISRANEPGDLGDPSALWSALVMAEGFRATEVYIPRRIRVDVLEAQGITRR